MEKKIDFKTLACALITSGADIRYKIDDSVFPYHLVLAALGGGHDTPYFPYMKALAVNVEMSDDFIDEEGAIEVSLDPEEMNPEGLERKEMEVNMLDYIASYLKHFNLFYMPADKDEYREWVEDFYFGNGEERVAEYKAGVEFFMRRWNRLNRHDQEAQFTQEDIEEVKKHYED